MAESERPRSPFAGKIDFSARAPHRVLSPDEIGQILAAHRLYVETERRQGRGFVTLLTEGVRAPVCAACQAGIPAASRHSVMASPRKCRWVLALVRCRQWLNRL